MMPGRAAALVVVLGSGAGCTLVLGFDDPVVDASLPDGPSIDAMETPDAAPDPYEPNNTPAAATAIEPGTLTGLTVAPANDVDYYSFVLAGPSDVTIDVLFTHAIGDIDLRLFDSVSVTPVASSAGETDNERIELTGAMQLAAGTYYVNVYSARGENTYDLTLAVVAAPTPDAPPATDAGP